MAGKDGGELGDEIDSGGGVGACGEGVLVGLWWLPFVAIIKQIKIGDVETLDLSKL